MKYFETYALPHKGELIPIWQLKYEKDDYYGDWYILPDETKVSQMVELIPVTWNNVKGTVLDPPVVVEHYPEPKYRVGDVVYMSYSNKLTKEVVTEIGYQIDSEKIKPYRKFDKVEKQWYNLPEDAEVIHLKLYKPEYVFESGSKTTYTYDVYTMKEDV